FLHARIIHRPLLFQSLADEVLNIGYHDSLHVDRIGIAAAATPYEAFQDVRGLQELGFDLFGIDLLAAGRDDDRLFAPLDVEESVLVHIAEIPRVQPAVFQGLPRSFWIVVVAGHDAGTSGQDLAVLRDLQFQARQGETDGVVLEGLWPVYGQQWRRLG